MPAGCWPSGTQPCISWLGPYLSGKHMQTSCEALSYVDAARHAGLSRLSVARSIEPGVKQLRLEHANPDDDSGHREP